MSLASYQGWEVGSKTGRKVYQCVMDAAPYRWQQQQQQQQHRNLQQADATKTNNVPTLSMYIHHSSSSQCESSEPTSKSSVSESSGGTAASPVSCSKSPFGECGPVSSYVLPSLVAYPGSERVPLIGEELEVVNSLASGRSGCLDWSNGNSQRGLRNGGHLKVHPHDHDDDLDSCGQESKQPTKGLSKDCLDFPSTVSPPSLFQTVGPALSSSSSSIGVGGEHSFSSEESEDNTGDGEVQSALRPAALSTLSALENSLPIKRGLSRCFTGQSKSFGCLSDALSTSLAKPANPYARRRKNFVLLSEDRQRTCPPVSRKSASGISKKNSFGNKSNLALAVAMEAAQQEEDDNDENDDEDNDDDDDDDEEEEEEEEDNDHPTPLPRMGLGRLYDNAPSRSYSLSDLQGVVPTRAFSLSDLQGVGRG